MHEYPKTENLFTRDPDTHKLVIGQFRDPAISQVDTWHVTEKVDGTNIRVLLRLDTRTPQTHLCVDVRGRSDRANVPQDLVAAVTKRIEENADAVIEWVDGLTRSDDNIVVCLYGEGYGPGIQKSGGAYRPAAAGKSVRIFDVATTHVDEWPEANADGPTWWRGWDDTLAASAATGLDTVPAWDRMTMDEIIGAVSAGFESLTAALDGGEGLQAEGLIGRTDPYLYDHRGHRVMFKLKTKDVS